MNAQSLRVSVYMEINSVRDREPTGLFWIRYGVYKKMMGRKFSSLLLSHIHKGEKVYIHEEENL